MYKRTGINIGVKTLELIDEKANKLKLSRSRVIEMILIEYFEKLQATQNKNWVVFIMTKRRKGIWNLMRY